MKSRNAIIAQGKPPSRWPVLAEVVLLGLAWGNFTQAQTNQPADLNTKAAEVLRGVVLLPDGKPAAGAEVAARVPGRHIYVGLNMSQSHANEGLVAVANSRGEFALPLGARASEVYAVHEQGYADISAGAFRGYPTIVLLAWGTMEGVVQVGNQPGTNVFIEARPTVLDNASIRQLRQAAGNGVAPAEAPGEFDNQLYLNSARTDAAGRFALSHLAPGEWRVGFRYFMAGGRSEGERGRIVSVRPGEVAEVNFVGEGRTVVGKLTLNIGPADWDWTNVLVALNTFAPSQSTPEERIQAHNRFHAARPLPDGSFRVDYVPAGVYQLTIVGQAGFQDSSPRKEVLRQVTEEFRKEVAVPEIPGDGSKKALDLGAIEVKVRVAPKASGPD